MRMVERVENRLKDGNFTDIHFTDQDCSTTIDWSASNQQDKGQDNNRWLARWCRRDPVASIRGHLVAGNDVLATKHKEEHHRDRDDREAVAGYNRWGRVATVLLATIRHRAPGLLFHTRWHAVSNYRPFADIFDAPFGRGWTFLQMHVSGVIDARRDAADSLVVLSAFVTSDTVCQPDAEEERREENRRESSRGQKHPGCGDGSSYWEDRSVSIRAEDTSGCQEPPRGAGPTVSPRNRKKKGTWSTDFRPFPNFPSIRVLYSITITIILPPLTQLKVISRSRRSRIPILLSLLFSKSSFIFPPLLNSFFQIVSFDLDNRLLKNWIELNRFNEEGRH